MVHTIGQSPEKDVQWSNVGVAAANKFLQKIWDINFIVSNRKEKKINKELESKFVKDISLFSHKLVINKRF